MSSGKSGQILAFGHCHVPVCVAIGSKQSWQNEWPHLVIRIGVLNVSRHTLHLASIFEWISIKLTGLWKQVSYSYQMNAVYFHSNDSFGGQVEGQSWNTQKLIFF